jgi:hypothetical protein
MSGVDRAAAAVLLGLDEQLVDMRLFGVRLTAVVQPDEREIRRRAPAGLGVLDDVAFFDLLEVLSGLPLGCPVPWAELDPDAQVELDCAPAGVVDVTPTHVRRVWQPAVKVTGLLAVARDWRVGLYQARLVAAELPSAVALTSWPRRPGAMLAAAHQAGVGVVAVGDDGRWRRLLPSAGGRPAGSCARRWQMLEAVYDAYRTPRPPPDPRRRQRAARRARLLGRLPDAARVLGFDGQLVAGVRFAATTCTAVVTLDAAELARRAAAGLGALDPYRHHGLFEALAVLPAGIPVDRDELEPATAVELLGAPPGVVGWSGRHVTRLWRPAVQVTGVLVASEQTMSGLSRASWFVADAPRGLVALRRPRPATLAKAARLGIGVVAPCDGPGGWELLVPPAVDRQRALGPRHWRFLEAVTAALLRQQPQTRSPTPAARTVQRAPRQRQGRPR